MPDVRCRHALAGLQAQPGGCALGRPGGASRPRTGRRDAEQFRPIREVVDRPGGLPTGTVGATHCGRPRGRPQDIRSARRWAARTSGFESHGTGPTVPPNFSPLPPPRRSLARAPSRIRTGARALKTRSPRPLDDGGVVPGFHRTAAEPLRPPAVTRHLHRFEARCSTSPVTPADLTDHLIPGASMDASAPPATPGSPVMAEVPLGSSAMPDDQ